MDISIEHPMAASVKDRRSNNFNMLRFTLAALVIVSHAPQLLDGNPRREWLAVWTGNQIDLGKLAVDGFFIISGFLITQSRATSRSLARYMSKRVRRIYPGFIVASLLSSIAIGIVAGGHPNVRAIPSVIFRMLFLAKPYNPPGAFAGMPYPDVNGSLWTIPYEFVCYLLVACLSPDWLRRRWIVLLLMAVSMIVYGAQLARHVRFMELPWFLPAINEMPRLLCFFLVGSAAWLYRDRICYNTRGLTLAALSIAFSLYWHKLLIVLPFAGAYILLMFALHGPANLHKFGTRHDLSYGVYLYAWPLQNLLAFYSHRQVSIPLMIALPAIGSIGLAFLSWRFVESPFSYKELRS